MATIKLKDESTKTFSIDGVCYTKGDYRLQYNAKKEVLIIPKAVANISNLSGLPFKNPTAWTYFIDANDNPYNSFEEFSLAISDAINFNLGEATPQQYKFTLSQSGGDDPQTATSGTLTQGVTYEIIAFETGDDFTLSGAPNNDVGTKWIANGTAPTWGNGSEIGWNNGAPIPKKFVNTLNQNVWWLIEPDLFGSPLDGVYTINFENPIDLDKLFFPEGIISNNDNWSFFITKISTTKIAVVSQQSGNVLTNGLFLDTPLFFELYP